MNKRKANRRMVMGRRRLTNKQIGVFEIWDAGLTQIKAEIDRTHGSRQRNADQRKQAVLNRGVYRLIRDLLLRRKPSDVEAVLLHIIDSRMVVKFDKNPYYWALKAVARGGEISLNENVVSREADALLYASMHQIPPELLTGFVSQVGSRARIAQQLKDNLTEPWFDKGLPWCR